MTRNEDATTLKKLKFRFEKYDTMKTCPKAPTLFELNQMTLQGQLYLVKSDLFFVSAKTMCYITQNTNLVHKSMAPYFSTYKTLI